VVLQHGQQAGGRLVNGTIWIGRGRFCDDDRVLIAKHRLDSGRRQGRSAPFAEVLREPNGDTAYRRVVAHGKVHRPFHVGTERVEQLGPRNMDVDVQCTPSFRFSVSEPGGFVGPIEQASAHSRQGSRPYSLGTPDREVLVRVFSTTGGTPPPQASDGRETTF
jgi:hypothetical protein